MKIFLAAFFLLFYTGISFAAEDIPPHKTYLYQFKLPFDLEGTRKKAENGTAKEQRDLAYKLSLDGSLAVVVTDRKEAAYWYLKAAEQGDENSIQEIARHYAHGNYIQKDLVQAYIWFSLLQPRLAHRNYKYFDAVAEGLSSDQIAKARAIAEEKRKTLPNNTPKIEMGVFCLRHILLELQSSRTCDRYKRKPMDLEEAYFWLKLASLDTSYRDTGILLTN